MGQDDERQFDLGGKRVWVAGHRGMVGSAIVRRLASEDCAVLTVDRAELDLAPAGRSRALDAPQRPEAVFIAAAKVGGILANDTLPAEFIYDNLAIAPTSSRPRTARASKKLLFLGSSCIYPRARAAADARGRAADRAARADQRMVRDRQDRRHQAVPGLPPPVRRRFHLAPCRPTSTGRATITTSSTSHVAAGADRARSHEAKRARRAEVDDLGHGHARGASSCTSTISPTPACSC